MMFSLFFLFSFSYAGTVTINGDSYDCPEIADTVINCEFEDYIFVKYKNAYYSGPYYLLHFLDSSNSNYLNLSVLGREPAYIKDGIQNYRYRWLKTLDGVTYSLISSPELSGYKFSAHSDNKYKFSNSFVNQGFGYEMLSYCEEIEFLHCNYPAYNIEGTQNNWTLLDIEYEPSSDKIVMENPLSDAEIKSILDIFLESVRNADLPEHYGRYVLTYNKITGKYSGFVYPNYVDLGIEYHDFDDEGNRYRCISSVGPYYNFLVYHENNDYIDNLLDSISLLFKEHYIYEFRSNSTNTSFKFLESYSLFGTNLVDADIPFLLSTEYEPIIYTSHKIYSMFFIGNDLGVPNYIVDYETSIDNQIFTDDDGFEFDNTLNEFTESTDVSVGVFDFIRLLFGFIFSLVSFLSRFFVFIVSFVMVPASTNILPSEFVTGIEWLHTFAFGDILLWDIFSILFLVLLSTFIVNLIRSH